MKEYYIYLNQQEGPFTIDELRSKTISFNTPAWHEGLNEWSTVGEIIELRSLVKASPPPFQSPAQRDYEYEMEMAAFFPERKKLSWGLVIAVTIAAILFATLIWAMNR
ncbi:MAG TPA: DUF4339 domain-containing protein [Chitinophagaceae bacterium]